MRISLVSEHASPLALLGGHDAGGQNVHVAELASALARRGCDVTVHTRRDDPDLEASVDYGPGVVVDHIDAGPAAEIPKDDLLPWMGDFADELVERWRAWPPDAVYSHFWMSGIATLNAVRALDEPIPALHTYHALGAEKRVQQGAEDTSPRQRLGIEAELATDMDAIIATTEAERSILIDMGADPDRVRVVPCGVDLRRFQPAVAGDTERRPRIVAAARLVPRKGLDDLIRAAARLPDVEVVIAGGPVDRPAAEDPEGARLLGIARDLGMEDRVELLGAVDRDEIPDLFRTASVIVCCPWYEPFGMVALEAMACGVPVVASRVGGLAESVVHDGTGLLVPPKNPEALAAALAAILGDPERRARYGAAAIRRARRYGWDRIAANVLDVVHTTTPARPTASVWPIP